MAQMVPQMAKVDNFSFTRRCSRTRRAERRRMYSSCCAPGCPKKPAATVSDWSPKFRTGGKPQNFYPNLHPTRTSTALPSNCSHLSETYSELFAADGTGYHCAEAGTYCPPRNSENPLPKAAPYYKTPYFPRNFAKYQFAPHIGSVCSLFASISLERLYRSSQNLLCMSAGAVARCSSGGMTICYVLPVLWMTSGFALNGPSYGRFLSKCDNWNYLSYETEILTRCSFLRALHWNI